MARRLGLGTGLILGVALAVVVVWARGLLGPGSAGTGARPRPLRHVPEDASGPLRAVAIHYAPAADPLVAEVWRQLFAVLPRSVTVEVLVAGERDYDRFLAHLDEWRTPWRERFRPVVVGAPITTWSRDRFAALEGEGTGELLAPPQIGAIHPGRAGDWRSPHALSQALWGRPPRTAEFVFEGGDLASSPRHLFVDANLMGRNLGRVEATRAGLERALGRHVSQEVIWLGDAPGDVPRHHIMMYMVPLDDRTVAVGDVRAGLALLGAAAVPRDADTDGHAARFDRVAALLAARGFQVLRVPAVVLEGAGSYVTYTNALFDRTDSGHRVVYLPTYDVGPLDDAGARFYEALGYVVHRIDVSLVYRQNGSLGCLVNVVSRGEEGSDP